MRAFFYTLLGFSVVVVFFVASNRYSSWKETQEETLSAADPAPGKPPPPPPIESRSSALQMIQRDSQMVQNPPKEVDWASSYRYDTMQQVAYAARDNRPDLYKEFTSQRSLVAITGRYEQDKDFPSFIHELAASAEFDRLLSSRRRDRATHQFVGALFATPHIGGPLRQVFSESGSNPDLQDLARRYGWDLGMPSEVMSWMGIAKPQPRQRSKPKLKRLGNSSVSPTPIRSSFSQR